MEIDVMQLISNVGLPGAICLYVLMTINKTVKSNTDAINNLAIKIGQKDNSK